MRGINRFHVVLWHTELKTFLSVTYHSEYETLSERDMYEIEKIHADFNHGVMAVKTTIVSWQSLRK